MRSCLRRWGLEQALSGSRVQGTVESITTPCYLPVCSLIAILKGLISEDILVPVDHLQMRLPTRADSGGGNGDTPIKCGSKSTSTVLLVEWLMCPCSNSGQVAGVLWTPV